MQSVQGKKENSRYSPGTYFCLLTMLALGGFAVSCYLAYSHYRNFTDITYQSFCAVSRSLNCDTVSQSPQAVVADVPLAVWGALGYIFFIMTMALFRGDKMGARGWSVFLYLAGMFSLTSLYLAAISSFVIRSYCLMCVVTYAINFLLLYFSFLSFRRFGDETLVEQTKKDVSFMVVLFRKMIAAGCTFLALSFSIFLYFPDYWAFPVLSSNTHVNTGTTDDGTPWIGAMNPSLTITEFTDYMCFQCGKMHSHLRQLVNRYPEKIRLIHRHYPLDERINPIVKQTFHTNSGLLSLFAILADDSGKFWQVNDCLFRDARKKKISINQIAKENDMDLSDFEQRINDRKIVEKLEEDIRTGLRLGITATPTYLIDGKTYSGLVPNDILVRVIEGKR